MSDAETTLPRSRGPGSRRASGDAWYLYLRLVYGEGLAPDDPRLGKIFRMGAGPERTLLVGRSPGADERSLTLEYDGWASRMHTRISTLHVGEHAGLVVEDLGSRNGTFVDGEPVPNRAVARPGQVIRIGATVFVAGYAPLARLHRIVDEHPPPAGYYLASWASVALWEQVVRVAASDEGVLLLGELGTGKTHLARLIHELSARRAGPFVPFNCSAIPANLEEATLFGVVGGFIPTVKEKQGLLTRARGGTLFLDELAEMPPVAQAKLLDAFDPIERSYLPVGGSRRLSTDCRLVQATNRDVFALTAEGVVRHDLLSRLVVAQLTVPPLRERREDVLALFDLALRAAGSDATVPDAETAEALALGQWTENVRGLTTLARRVAIGETLEPEMVRVHAGRGAAPAAPPAAPAQAAAPASTRAPTTWPPDPVALLELLESHQWSVKDAAATVGRRRETVARLVARTFGGGGKETARMAYRVWKASRRVPGKGQVEALHALFFDAEPGPETDAARQAWTDRGEVPPETLTPPPAE